MVRTLGGLKAGDAVHVRANIVSPLHLFIQASRTEQVDEMDEAAAAAAVRVSAGNVEVSFYASATQLCASASASCQQIHLMTFIEPIR